ncbi:MAG: phosphatidylserine/phosphatidylglycerophosphate/cardiolipin synthase family protein [Bacteroidetes bacterium]|nr:phosphatidylserine/phosphatidylglycerophosphate/cardiolipin synthase family protein [Bacteroidota bacterium]
MTTKPNYKFKLFTQPPRLYEAMIEDIRGAKEYVYLELYRFTQDKIGIMFRDALIARAKEKVKIRLLIDSWGGTTNAAFFDDLVSLGGEVRFFKKIRFSFDFFTRNHRRNHRKLLLIDDNISYIGSANIAAHSLHWRELTLRLEGGLAPLFRRTFNKSFKNFNRYVFFKFSYNKTIFHHGYEIVQDSPSIYRQQIKKKLENLILKAKKSVIIETPYFLPGYMLRKRLMDAARRGVRVVIMMPWRSDVRSVDLLSSKYFGLFYNSDVKLLFYRPTNLHAKCILIDDEVFGVGSSNFDYRSFRYQHEIMLFGRDEAIVAAINHHLNESLSGCSPFDYEHWMRRPAIEKFFGWLLLPFRHMF